MPELPEVEHVARALNNVVIGRTIETAELRRPRLAPDSPPRSFAKKLSGTTVGSVGRRGKHILIGLDNGLTLIVHLRMSGRFMLLDADHSDPKFAHAVFHFTDRSRLVFEDQRHFGLMKIVDTRKLFEAKELVKLAPEPFSEEFSPDYLAARLRSSDRVLKDLLLDQTRVCGVGNIYASEALFLSGISPRRRGRGISAKRTEILYQNIKAVLREAIDLADAIGSDPVYIGEKVYGSGSRTRWRVYDREGQPCTECSSPIKRIRQAGRSTYYCSKCQR